MPALPPSLRSRSIWTLALSLMGYLGACGGSGTPDGGGLADAGDSGAADGERPDGETAPDGAASDIASPGDDDPSDSAVRDAGSDGNSPSDAGVSDAATDQPRTDFLFATPTSRSCNMASPIVRELADGSHEIIAVAMDGLIRAFDANTGTENWRAQLEAPDGQTAIVLATPVIVEGALFLAWQNATTRDGIPDHGRWTRQSHVVEALNLTTHAPDPRWPRLTLTATKPAYDGGSVEFSSATQLLRSALQHVEVDDREDGLLYISVGNGPSTQPFHGWVFELDLDAWRATGTGAAIANVLLTTSSNDCTPEGNATGAMVCGGGVWTPSGALISSRADDSYEIFVPTGNGRVDYDREAYAHSVIRTGRGLALEPNCDPNLCSPFDEFAPSLACLESCENVFSAHLPPGQQLLPDHSLCDGLGFMECYGVLDADLGSSSPVELQVPGGPRVLVQPGKDGALYLIDAEHLGTLFDRVQALELCGTDADPCPAIWTGQFVTTPLVSEVDGDPVVLVSGFNYDNTHAAGVVAYRVILENEVPVLRKLWQAPDPSSELAVQAFRRHTGRPILFDFEGESYMLLVEAHASGGHLWILRVRDGHIVQRMPLDSDGLKYTQPALLGDRLFIGTCDFGALANGRIEAFALAASSDPPVEFDDPADPDAMDELCEPGGVSCDASQYCDRSRCGGPGICHARPASCEAGEHEPVCGCDGLVYGNTCYAQLAGATVDPSTDLQICSGSNKCWRLTYGCEECVDGYVWRGIEGAPGGDRTCVLPAARTRVVQENAAHAERVDSTTGACVDGYVFREAYDGDVICVTPAARDAAAQENADHWVRTRVGADT